MKILPLLILLTGLPASQIVAAPTTDLTLRVAPEREIVYNQGPREIVVQIDLDAKRPQTNTRSPINLCLVLDRSGSMQGAKIEKAKQAACLAIDHLSDQDFLSLVTFDNQSDTLIAPERVGDERHRSAMKSRIDRIRPGGGTAIYDGVSLGAEQLRRNLQKEFVNRIILLSDGLANSGPSRTSDLAKLGKTLRQDGLSVTTVGLGDDYNEDLMTALAEASSANYYYVRDAEKLPGIFAEELGVARSLVAREVIIRIRVPEGVRLKEIIGQPQIHCQDRSAEITLPECFGGDKRRFLARCVVLNPQTAAIEVASVDLRYQSSSGIAATTDAQAAKISFSDQEKKADESIQADVTKEVAVAENRLTKEKAVKLSDEGKSKDAALLLRDQVTRNLSAPGAAQLPEMKAENRALEAAAQEVEEKGQLSSRSRKTIQYENWQDKYQKR